MVPDPAADADELSGWGARGGREGGEFDQWSGGSEGNLERGWRRREGERGGVEGGGAVGVEEGEGGGVGGKGGGEGRQGEAGGVTGVFRDMCIGPFALSLRAACCSSRYWSAKKRERRGGGLGGKRLPPVDASGDARVCCVPELGTRGARANHTRQPTHILSLSQVGNGSLLQIQSTRFSLK